MKITAPIKAKIKNLKVELAMLVTTDKPDTNAINKKIDELTKLKNDKMREKYKYIIAKRKVLTAEQQVLFDTRVIQKAMHGKGKGDCRR
jgi:Spy/CpxP family protein refolding chaperone